MAIVPSYYDNLAASQNLQLLIDQSQDVLSDSTIWRQWLSVAPKQYSLNFESVIGRDRIAAAASIVDEDAPAPLRSRNKLERYSGRIPVMKKKFAMRQSEMRELLVLRQLPITNGSNRLIDFMVRDLEEASIAGEKKVDIMLLQALSTLTMDLSISGNPDGVAYGTIDLLPLSVQKQGVGVVWTDAANATPIDDIKNFIRKNKITRGRSFGQIIMSESLWWSFQATAQVKSYINTFFYTGRPNQGAVVTLDTVNAYFSANGWPPITTVEDVANMEVDGQPSFMTPFDQSACVFAPAGKVGELANAYSMEELNPVEGKTY